MNGFLSKDELEKIIKSEPNRKIGVKAWCPIDKEYHTVMMHPLTRDNFEEVTPKSMRGPCGELLIAKPEHVRGKFQKG